MNNLLTRTLAVALVAILSFAVMTGLVIGIGFRNVITNSDKRNNDLLTDFIDKKLETLSSAQTGTIADAMHDLPVRTDYVAVQNNDGQVIFLSRKGKILPQSEWHTLGKHLEKNDWHDAPDSGPARFRFAFKAVHIDAEDSSKIILSAIRRTALWGALAACVFAGLSAYALSRPLSRQAKKLAAGLSAMENGRRDVTLPEGGLKELRDIATSASKLQDTLRKEEAVRVQWTSDIAHDLRTPLTVLKGQFEGMLDGVFLADRSRLEKNYQEILKLEHLVLQLSELTRMESPGYVIDCQRVDALALLAEQARRFTDSARSGNRKITVAPLPADFPRGIQADAALLERALENLIDNAIRYGEPDGEIRLSLALPGKDHVSFIVENAGVIAPSDRPHVFDRLYRGDRSRSTRGSGIGLAIVQAIAQAHGGTIRLECDESANRTRFVLSIPVCQSREASV